MKLTLRVVFTTSLILLFTEAHIPQTCFYYSDNVNAKVPFTCVQKSDMSSPCAWPEDCTSIPSSTPQTILSMHTDWHNCFGNVADGVVPPAGRSQRWYAFHRQFEYDFNLWRDDIPIAHIESLDWCPGMNLPEGHPSATPGGIPGHPAGCGNGNPRPDNVACAGCEALPTCMFLSGAGPAGCAASADPGRCPAGMTLEDFPNIDEVASVMDDYYHGDMHGAIEDAGGGIYVGDAGDPSCSPRDPMFWRLHKALDDVVRAWQDHKAVDIIIVIDRSGSMSDPAVSGGTSTKLDAALESAEMFADMMETVRTDGQQNRIGIVSYSSTATLDMSLTNTDASLLSPGGALMTALDNIRTLGASGCTGIGGGIEKALEELCPPGNCNGFSAAGDNDRKAILLLTDGIENTPPCLLTAGGGSGSCGSQCFGAQLDYDKLEFTQFVAVGFGESGSLNGELLTLLAERQGGIYMQNPNATPGDDLKYFFSIAFGHLSDEFSLLDPRGILPANRTITPPVTYNSCQDGKITFSSGWNTSVKKGGLRLIVTAPSGNLVNLNDPSIQASTQRTWAHARIKMPNKGEASGAWTAQLMRPHRQFVNGFTTDCFVDVQKGTAMIRRQIQRLCPDGCDNVLYFEDGKLGQQSVYEDALKVEQTSGLLKTVKQTNNANDFAMLLRQKWDLIVYAHQMDEKEEPYDQILARLVCNGQRAILTDTRPRAFNNILECLAYTNNSIKNFTAISGDGRLLDGTLKLKNPGHKIMSYTLGSNKGDVQAHVNAKEAAVVATFDEGQEQHWFINVLGQGLSKISPHSYKNFWKTGEGLMAVARVLPSYFVAGGYDKVNARVIVEHPLVSIGNAIKDKWSRNEINIKGEFLNARVATMRNVHIPTKTDTFLLYDDGTHGDVVEKNAYWSGLLDGLGKVDGMYRFRFVFDFIKDGCAVTRELNRSVFVEIGIDPGSSGVNVGSGNPEGNNVIIPVTITPKDAFGNIWGPGRLDIPICRIKEECQVDAGSIKDNEDGSYTMDLKTPKDVAGVRLDIFGSTFDIPLSCNNCPKLVGFEITPSKVNEDGQVTGKIKLNGPAPKAGLGGAVIYLSADDNFTVQLPSVAIVPEGQTEVTFPFTTSHVHDDPVQVKITATYGSQVLSEILTVTPTKHHDDNQPGWLKILYISLLAIIVILVLWWISRRK